MGNNNEELSRVVAELTVHIDYLRKELSSVRERLEQTATSSDLEALELRLKKQIDENAPSALFWTLTKAAAGVVSIAAAVGVFLALLKVFAK